MNFWDFFWLLIWSYLFVACLVVLFHIAADLFRDPELGGFAKALWIIALIVAPILVALIYLIARGRGMAERQKPRPRRLEPRRIDTSSTWRPSPAPPTRSPQPRPCSKTAPSPKTSTND